MMSKETIDEAKRIVADLYRCLDNSASLLTTNDAAGIKAQALRETLDRARVSLDRARVSLEKLQPDE